MTSHLGQRGFYSNTAGFLAGRPKLFISYEDIRAFFTLENGSDIMLGIYIICLGPKNIAKTTSEQETMIFIIFKMLKSHFFVV